MLSKMSGQTTWYFRTWVWYIGGGVASGLVGSRKDSRFALANAKQTRRGGAENHQDLVKGPIPQNGIQRSERKQRCGWIIQKSVDKKYIRLIKLGIYYRHKSNGRNFMPRLTRRKRTTTLAAGWSGRPWTRRKTLRRTRRFLSTKPKSSPKGWRSVQMKLKNQERFFKK